MNGDRFKSKGNDTLSCPVLSFSTLHCVVLSCLVERKPFHKVMHATLSCPVLSYLVLSCLLERRPFHEVIPHCLVLSRLVLS